MKKYIQNNRGLTLVEILAALIILSLVFLAFMTFFTQSAKFTMHNKETLTAVQVAEDVVAEARIGKYFENTSFQRNSYKIDIKIENGPIPTNLKKATIEVTPNKKAINTNSKFITQMYFEVSN
jgi:type IV pilus assembly protein PilA